VVFGFDRNSEKTLHKPVFYRFSCLANMVSSALAARLLPAPGFFVAIACFLVSAFLLVQHLLRGESLSPQSIRRGYLAKIYAGMVLISIGIFQLDREYAAYFPIVMGMLYLNVNTILRSALLHRSAIALMLLSIVKAVLLHHQSFVELAEYGSISVMLVASALLTFELFRSNKRTYEENEHQAATLMAVSKMLNQLLVHDVNNALTSIFIVAAERFRSDKALFMEELERRVGVVQDHLHSRIWDHQEPVDVAEVMDQMTALVGGPGVNIQTEIVDGARVVTSRNMLYSILRNLLENSMEAASRTDRACVVRVRKVGRTISVEDECGGFDIEDIRQGRSAKPGADGHGVFLNTITSPVIQVAFGFKVALSRTRTGTRVELAFDRVEE
jgi:signal transduction histidine kinase